MRCFLCVEGREGNSPVKLSSNNLEQNITKTISQILVQIRINSAGVWRDAISNRVCQTPPTYPLSIPASSCTVS